MYASTAPADWLPRFIVEAPEELRIAWADQVKRALIELDPAEGPAQWSRWIEAYWLDRNQSVPLPFTPAEASATAGWVLGLAGVRSRAIDLVLGSQASLTQHGGFLHRLKDLDLAAEANDWARLLTHLLKNTSGPQCVGDHLKEIVPILREGTPSPDLAGLINEAMRLGATNAGDW
ncbi:MAG: DUF4020 domain-containing protein [Chthonomonadales bacterium]|nr:DUF4020 domain-containing protein [Chthonomonadales bacterium]